MKSPIKDLVKKTRCIGMLKAIIPRGSVIDSFLFYSGEVEFGLSAVDRFVNAHTNSYPVYEFWSCMEKDNHRLYDIVNSDIFKFQSPEMFPILQENWVSYQDPYIRSALFFLLNSCSEYGRVSSGPLNVANYNPMSLSYIKSYKPLPTFHLTHTDAKEWLSVVGAETSADYLYVPAGRFAYNLFAHGKSIGWEETEVNHRLLLKKLSSIQTKWIVTYNYHKALKSHCKDFHFRMVDKYGRLTSHDEECCEIIVTNF